MNQQRLWLCIGVAALLLAGGAHAQGKSLAIGSVEGSAATVPITMTSDEPIEGFVLSVAFDTTKITATDVRVAGAAAAAELVVPEILPEGFTLGVIMDFEPPYGGQTIPAGTALVAEADLRADMAALGLDPGDTVVLPVAFLDGLNDPPLSNIIVAGGMSFGAGEGLGLAGGAVTIVGKGDDIRIVSTTGALNANSIPVSITVDSTEPVEGYVLSIAHDPALTLASIAVGAAASSAEFFVPRTYANGGTLGVVMDLDPPYAGQTVPVGVGNEIAVFTYTRPAADCAATRSDTYALTFVDEVFGHPLLSNTLVQDGMSIPPNLNNGTVTFVCGPAVEGINFYAGGDTAPETDPAGLGCAVGRSGSEAMVVFYYTSATQPIQGISMAVEFDAPLKVVDLDATHQGIVGARQLDDTLTKFLNAEFVSFNANNDTRQLIIGILVDSTPPVPLNHMYPPRDTLGKVLNVYFSIPAGQPCHEEYGIRFKNGVLGAGEVAISNRVAVFNASYPATTHNGCVRVGGAHDPEFIRGDCNTDWEVDIADPAATMSYLFLGVYSPKCLDACDSNDDGVVDLADVVNTLRFLFKQGPRIPAPYPTAGTDPTPDIYGLDLGCDTGNVCD